MLLLKDGVPGPLFVLPQPSPASVPAVSPSLAPGLALDCSSNKTLARGDRRPSGTARAIGSNGFCQAGLRAEPPAPEPVILLTPAGMSSAAYRRKPQHEQPPPGILGFPYLASFCTAGFKPPCLSGATEGMAGFLPAGRFTTML